MTYNFDKVEVTCWSCVIQDTLLMVYKLVFLA